MNYALHKLGGADVGVVVMLALYALFGQRDSLLRAVLQTAEALDAVCAEGGLSVNKADVALWTELFALAAADACVGDGKFLGFADCELRPNLALKRVEPHFRRRLLALFARENGFDKLFCRALAALLRHLGRNGRQHELVGEQPYARALVRKAGPQIELELLVDLVQAAAEISGVLADGEGVGIRRDPDAAEKALDVTGQTAAIAGDDKADALRVSNIGLHRRLTHHDDVRIAETFCDVLCKVQTVAASGIAEYNVFAHCSLLPC